MHKLLPLYFLLFLLLPSCGERKGPGKDPSDHPKSKSSKVSFAEVNKPFTRYWWFASEVNKKAIRQNLDWLKKKGFGGIELAWVYPLSAMNDDENPTRTPRDPWLSPAWQEKVRFTMRYADSIGLACDLTMGTLWPFGDSRVSYEQAAQRFGTDERQRLKKTWEHPKKGYVVDHLNPRDYMPYMKRILDSFPQVSSEVPRSYFIDSWEVESKRLWTDGFGRDFQERYGYRIQPHMDSIYKKGQEAQLYDYMKLISEKTLSFYQAFDSILDTRNIRSRGQCAGAPCDIISAYSNLDVPEGEAMLYEPAYNNIPASAAALGGNSYVSAESFTCLYGWPDHHMREEQAADLKLVADALYASGVNQILWHGKPHVPFRKDSVNFFATTHLGPDSELASEIRPFNEYLRQVSRVMKKGKPYSDVAVYLPTEDAWRKGKMPKEQRYIWAWGAYEMRYQNFPQEVRGHHPLWINRKFMEKGELNDEGRLQVGDAAFNALYVEAAHLDPQTLERLADLASKGFPITLKKTPRSAGTREHPSRDSLLRILEEAKNVKTKFEPSDRPLLKGDTIPPYWARKKGNTLYIFFAHPKCKDLNFPFQYGESASNDTLEPNITVRFKGSTYEQTLRFTPQASLLMKYENGNAESLDIRYRPPEPEIEKRGQNAPKPWKEKGSKSS